MAPKMRGIRSVAKQLGIKCKVCVYLYEFLGEETFQKLLIAHGLCGNGMQKSNPVPIQWICEGPPEAGSIAAQPCSNLEGAYVTCLGRSGKIPDHVFDGWFMCVPCQRKMPRREQEVLEMMERQRVPMTDHQRKRLATLLARRVEHQGRFVMSNHIRERNRTKQAGRKRKKCATVTVKETQREIRRSRAKKGGYPSGLIQKMSAAIKLWIQLYGREKVFCSDLIRVCDAILMREFANFGMERPAMMKSGPNYHGLSYDAAWEPHLQQASQNNFEVKNMNEFTLKPNGEKVEDLLKQLVATLYPDSPNVKSRVDET